MSAYMLFLIWILHQTTTVSEEGGETLLLFLIWILHQTTTITLTFDNVHCCFLFGFYIKPQPRAL